MRKVALSIWIMLWCLTGPAGMAEAAKRVDQTADALAARGHGVAGIDVPDRTAAQATDPADGGCRYIAGDLAEAGKIDQPSWGMRAYRHAMVAGIGTGRPRAMAALADPPPATLAGAIAADSSGTALARLPFRPPENAEPAGTNGLAHRPPASPKGWLVVASWHQDEPISSAWMNLAGFRPIRLDPGLALPTAPRLAVEAGQEIQAQPDKGSLADLPLVDLPVAGPSRAFAIVLSGDGGWRDFDKSIATVFVVRGLPTLGLDSLRYFWTQQPPAEVVRDLDRIVRHYRRQSDADLVLLVGYSFGADVLPAVWPLLAEETRGSVGQVSLLALGLGAGFGFHVAGWLGWGQPDVHPIPPDLARMDRSRVQCFFGADEGPEETGCRGKAAAGCQQIKRPGEHHFDGDDAAIAKTMLAGLRQRGGGTW